jgi:serine/threonine protein kinase
LEDFEILEKNDIAGGGFDAVARRRADGTTVRLWAGAVGHEAGEGGVRAADLAARLGKVYQASLPRVLEGFESERRAVFVVQHYSGIPLAERMQRGPLEILEALDIGKAIGAALAKAHAAGILHGHLDERSIFLHEDGRALLLHLGLSSFLSARGPRAPEDLRTAPSETSDVFGLARVFFRLVLHRDPYDSSEALAQGPQVRSCDLPPEIPEGLRRFLARSIHPDLSLRIRRAEEFGGDLRVLRASWDSITRVPEKVLPFPRLARVGAWLLLGRRHLPLGAWMPRGGGISGLTLSRAVAHDARSPGVIPSRSIPFIFIPNEETRYGRDSGHPVQDSRPDQSTGLLHQRGSD